MSDEAPETADKAIRSWLGAVAFTLVLVGGDMMAEKEGLRFWIGASLIVAALPIYLSAAWWRLLKTKINPEALGSVRKFASAVPWWLRAVFIFGVAVLLSIFIGPPLAANLATIVAVFVVVALTAIWVSSRRHPQRATVEIGSPVLTARAALAMHTCRIVVLTDALNKDLYLDIDVVIHNGELVDLSIGPISGKIRFEKLAKDFPDSPVAIHDNYSPSKLPKPEFTLRLRQWMPREFADAIIQGLENCDTLILTLEKLTIHVSKTTEPEFKFKLPIWDGIRLYRSIAVGKVVSLRSNLGTTQGLIIG